MAAVSIEAKIPEGLFAYFATITLPAGVRVSYPNLAFTPDTHAYIRLTVAKNTPVTSHIGGGKEPIRVGLFMATVCWPINQGGIIGASDLAATIRNAFKYNTKIDHAGIRIWVTGEPDVKGDMVSGAFTEIPVVIPWSVFP